MKEVHGTAKLTEGKYLTITTQAKRGKKMVPNVQTYLVEDVNPDPEVAYPAYSLTKGEFAAEDGQAVFVPSGDVWHVSVREWGAECDCPHRTFNPNAPVCKHAKAMQAVGFDGDTLGEVQGNVPELFG